MNTYYIAEDLGSYGKNWKPTRARTTAAAKRIATRVQMFQGTHVYVGLELNGTIFPVAMKLHRHALDMNAAGKWRDC